MPPSMAAKPEGEGIARVVELLATLRKKKCDSARSLAQAWQAHPTFLQLELSSWLPKKSSLLTDELWSRLMADSHAVMYSM